MVYFRKTDVLDINEIVSFFRGALGQFADRSAKWLLSNPENLRGLLEIIGENLVASLNFSRVQRVNTTFIADNLREQESDLVFLLPFRDTDETEVMIYILIEHQSTVDPAMGFRMFSYMYNIWDQQRQQWVAAGIPKSQWRFRPIIPVVFYTGQAEWRPVISMETLMDVPEALRRFVPSFETLFLGIQGESDANLLKTESPFGWLMTVLKRADTPDPSVFVSVLETLADHLSDMKESERAAWVQAVCYLYALVVHKRSVGERADLDRVVSKHQRTLNISQEEVNLMQTMAEHYLQQGIEQGIEQGIARGARETMIENTLAILTTRFPHADATVLKPMLEAISDLDRLKALHVRALTVPSLQDFQQDIST